MRFVGLIILSLYFSMSYAENGQQPLPADHAFALSVMMPSDKQLLLRWEMAPDYYLYRDSIKIAAGPFNQIKLGQLVLPLTQQKKTGDGEREVYAGVQTVQLALAPASRGMLEVIVAYQGCSSQGFCYSPMMKTLKVDVANLRPPQDLTRFLSVSAPVIESAAKVEQKNVQTLLTNDNVFVIILGFLGFGLLLAFTPCVLPLIPVLSGIIIGHHKKKLPRNKIFLLSLAYVFGVAFAYAVAGFVLAFVGSQLQAEMQRPWVIVLFSGLFVLLALALFDVYTLRFPRPLQAWFHQWSHRQSAGTYLGAFFMGCLASLIVSPCVTPPLVGVLAYIAQTGNQWLGAMSLFAFGFGMGLPLLLLGISAGKWLPKTGVWMMAIERLAGVIMLIFALWMLSRILPGALVLFLWSVMVIVGAIYLMWLMPWFVDRRLQRALALILLIYGVLVMLGAMLGNTNPFDPLKNGKAMPFFAKSTATIRFVTVTQQNQLNDRLAEAKNNKKFVLINFSAAWCESCARMEYNVLNHPCVLSSLSNVVLLKVDVTHQNAFEKAIMKRFHVLAPPTYVFIDNEGRELISEQIVGEVSAMDFVAHVSRIVKISTDPQRGDLLCSKK